MSRLLQRRSMAHLLAATLATIVVGAASGAARAQESLSVGGIYGGVWA